MQLSRTKFQKSFILSTKKWIKCFPGKNSVNSRGKSGDITPVPASSPRPPRVPLLRAKGRRIGCPGPPAPNRIRARGPAARPQRAGGGAVSPAGPRSQRRRDSMRDCLSPDAGLLVTCVWARDWSSADQLQVCLVAQLCFLPLSERLSFPAVLDSQARQGLACLRRTSGRIRTAWEVKCISAGIRGVRCASPGQSPEKEAHKLTAPTDPVPHIQPAKQSSQAPRHNISMDFILLWMIDSAWMIEFDGR